MKKTWYKLPFEEITQIYCIPAEIANDPSNHFWGLTYHSTIELFEGHLPLVVLSINGESPSIVTLQIFTAPMEVLHEPGPNGELENGNPLEWTEVGHYLSLPLEQLDGLCHILQAQKHLFVDAESAVTYQPVFRLLSNDEIRMYRLHPEWFPDVQKFYFIQVGQPVIDPTRNTISLVSISTPSILSSKMAFNIMTFEKDQLLDKSFTPLRRSSPQLYLNWLGLRELVDILTQVIRRVS